MKHPVGCTLSLLVGLTGSFAAIGAPTPLDAEAFERPGESLLRIDGPSLPAADGTRTVSGVSAQNVPLSVATAPLPAPAASNGVTDREARSPSARMPDKAARPIAAAALPAVPGRGPSETAQPPIEIDPELQEAARAALTWARDTKQAVQTEIGFGDPTAAPGAAAAAAAQRKRAADQADADSDPAGSRRNGSARAALSPQDTEPYAYAAGSDFNPIRESIRFVREMAQHPVTWLLIPMLALVAAAIGLIQQQSSGSRRGRHRSPARRGGGVRNLAKPSHKSAGTQRPIAPTERPGHRRPGTR
jgi:hypothetical protein